LSGKKKRGPSSVVGKGKKRRKKKRVSNNWGRGVGVRKVPFSPRKKGGGGGRNTSPPSKKEK